MIQLLKSAPLYILGGLATILLPQCADADEPVSLDRGNFGPFERSLNERPYGYEIMAQNFPAPHSAPHIEKFEVRGGDCFAHSDWNDCAKDRERSELSEKGSRNALGSEYLYHWQFFMPSDFPDLHKTKTIMGQFHQYKSHPVWIFTFQNGLYLERRISGKIDEKTPLLSVQQMHEQWHDIKIHASWQKTYKGFFHLWINDIPKLKYQGPTLSADLVYFKYGLYRAYISRYLKQHNLSVLPTQILYYANMQRRIP